jgi:hypothetical protein
MPVARVGPGQHGKESEGRETTMTQGSYPRFVLMVATSTVLMFALMYFNTYAAEHVFFSQTRAWMALAMGALMAAVMLSFMSGMYRNRRANRWIWGISAVVFAVSIGLVRSQATVGDASYLRAMIPHHSIAVMTSERARIADPRVRKLADEILGAQRREIAEMRFLVAHAADPAAAAIDPPARPGTVAEALANPLAARLDPAPMTPAEIESTLGTPATCRFRNTRASDPVLATGPAGAAMKLNGILIRLGKAEADGRFTAEGVTMTVHPLPDPDWRSDAELLFDLGEAPPIGYRGFYACGDR